MSRDRCRVIRRATAAEQEEDIAPAVVAEAGRRPKGPRPDLMAVAEAADIARARAVGAEVAVVTTQAAAEAAAEALRPAVAAAVAVPEAGGIGKR